LQIKCYFSLEKTFVRILYNTPFCPNGSCWGYAFYSFLISLSVFGPNVLFIALKWQLYAITNKYNRRSYVCIYIFSYIQTFTWINAKQWNRSFITFYCLLILSLLLMSYVVEYCLYSEIGSALKFSLPLHFSYWWFVVSAPMERRFQLLRSELIFLRF
jgi:hypothetical protein